MPARAQRVALVDDNEVIRMALRSILRQADFEVVGEARDADSALALIEREKPDLVCLDVIMPGRSGIEVLAEIRERFSAVKVLMVTGRADRETVDKVIKLGATGFVVKPFNAARVIETVQLALRHR